MENGPFQNVFPIENRDHRYCPLLFYTLPGCLTYPLYLSILSRWFSELPVWWDMYGYVSFPAWYLFIAAKNLFVLRLLRTNWHHRTNGPADCLGEWLSASPRHGVDTVPWLGWFRRTYNNQFTTQIVCGLEKLHVVFTFLFFLDSV